MLPDFKILNSIELEKVEYFKYLKERKKEIDLKNIIFEIHLEKTNVTEKDNIGKVNFSLNFFRRIEVYYTHLFDEKIKNFIK